LILEEIPLKVEIEDVSSCRKTLKIEIPAEDVNAEYEKAYEEVRRNAEIPGFRKDRAPRSVIKMRFSQYIKAEVVDKLVPPAFEKAAEDAKLEILRSPDPEEDIKPPYEEMSVKENEPLNFVVTVDVKPEITIPDLEKLEVEKGDVNVPKEDVDSYLEQMRNERADFIPVEDRPSQEGDYVTVGITLTSDGEVLNEEEEEVLELGESLAIQEMIPHLVDMNNDDEKDFTISFPEDYKVESLAGKEVDFHISLQKIAEKHLPDLDDDFAKDLGEDDLEHLIAKVWNQLVEFTRQEHRSKQQDDLVEQLLEKSQFEVPEFLVEERAKAQLRIDRLISRTAESEEPTEEELEHYRESALKATRTMWILDKIAQNEDIGVAEAEVEAEIRRIALERGRDPQKYKKLMEDANRIDGLTASIWERKVFDLLIEKAAEKRTLIV
jgi:trigger factor